MYYKPLPDNLTIKKSDIDGLGLFAVEEIRSGVIGIGWVKQDIFPDGYIRTPLGGFINHSKEPNCIKVKPIVSGFPSHWPTIKEGEKASSMAIRTSRDIKEDEELTVFYTLYKIDK